MDYTDDYDFYREYYLSAIRALHKDLEFNRGLVNIRTAQRDRAKERVQELEEEIEEWQMKPSEFEHIAERIVPVLARECGGMCCDNERELAIIAWCAARAVLAELECLK